MTCSTEYVRPFHGIIACCASLPTDNPALIIRARHRSSFAFGHKRLTKGDVQPRSVLKAMMQRCVRTCRDAYASLAGLCTPSSS